MTAMRVGVIGGGLVGLAIARRLALLGTHDVTVLEKESDIAQHQSGHNSGVVHAGVYYPPNSLKATLCRRGAGMLREFCAGHGLVIDPIGKVVVARRHDELDRLADIEQRARANGVPGLRRLDARGLREIEPHVTGVAALHSPTTAIVDFVAVARAMADDLVDAGGRVLTGHEVVGITAAGTGVSVCTRDSSQRFDQLVVCAGLQSDRVARFFGDALSPLIVPFRGEYYRLVAGKASLVSGLVYPVPDPAYPFLGVHFTPRVDGAVDIGPNAVLATAREGYRRRDLEWRQLTELATYPGVRRLMRRHWRAGVSELRGSLSKRSYLKLARAYVPEIRSKDIVRSPAGVRAQAVEADGSLLDDFRLGRLGPVVTVRNAPSPAATSSLAIADVIVGKLLDKAVA
jgi:L-2-hydroxyglutarate oxidase LhgO